MNNPPAFPKVVTEAMAEVDDGMSLRDYFAAAAFSKLKWAGGATASVLAQKSYELADAMLAEREKVKP